MTSTARPRLALRLQLAAPIACALLGASDTALAKGRCPPCPPDACQNDPAVWPAIQARKAQLRKRGFPERLLQIVEKLPRCLRCVRGPDQIDAFHLVEVGLDGKPAHAPTVWSAAAERLARDHLRAGKIRSIYIYLDAVACACCEDQPREDWDEKVGLHKGLAVLLEKDNAGADPQDLTELPARPDVGQRVPRFKEPNPPRQAHALCPACGQEAETRNAVAGRLYQAELKGKELATRWAETRATMQNVGAEQQLLHDLVPSAMSERRLGELERQMSELLPTAERLESEFEANAASAKALVGELAAADAVLGTCQARRCRPAATPRPPEAPRASVNLHVGPSLDLGLIIYSQLAFRVSALLRVLPRGLPGFLVFAPTLAVLGGYLTLHLPLGFQYEYLLPRIPISLYARFSLGYAAQFIGSGPLVLERSSALFLPEGGVLYRFARLPLQVGADLLSVAILVNRAYTAGSYQILGYAGWTFGR